MNLLDVEQGTPRWLEIRRQHDCASDAPAMMGASSYMSRNELLKRRRSGVDEEVDAFKQRLFDAGHAAEAAIRPHIEKVIGDELYPAVGTEGRLLASFDGITMDESTLYEHKLWSEALAAQVRAGELEPMYYWQLEHQLLVSKAQRVIFVCSDGTPQKCVYTWYEPRAGRAKQLEAGWKQFREDLANDSSAPAAVVAIAAPTEALPAVSVRMDGAIAVISNLDLFGAKLKAFIDQLDDKPSTDQAFADTEAAVKTLQKAEDALRQAEASALAQTSSIDEMRRTVGLYADMARTTRLMLEKMVKSRKDEIRGEIVFHGREAWGQHVAAINKRLARVKITTPAPDLAAAIKGKRTIDSLRGAVDDALAKAKIAASGEADDMAANLKVFDELAVGYEGLFRDLQDLVTINPEHLAGVIRGRIAEHEKAEAARLEKEREKIRAEEEARAQREAEKKAEADRQRIRDEERAKAKAEAQAAKSAPVTHTPEAIKPASAAAGAARVVTQGAGAAPTPARKPTRPTDAEIVEVLSQHYRVHETKVLEWLLDMDLETVSGSAMKEFT